MAFICPNSWDDDPIWLYNIVQGGWNHQLDCIFAEPNSISCAHEQVQFTTILEQDLTKLNLLG